MTVEEYRDKIIERTMLLTHEQNRIGRKIDELNDTLGSIDDEQDELYLRLAIMTAAKKSVRRFQIQDRVNKPTLILSEDGRELPPSDYKMLVNLWNQQWHICSEVTTFWVYINEWGDYLLIPVECVEEK